MTADRFYGQGFYGAMRQHSWCVCWCAFVCLEAYHPAKVVLRAYSDAVKNGIVFA